MKRKKKERKDFWTEEQVSHQYARDGCSFKAWVGSAGNFFRSDLVASLLRKRKPQIIVNSPFLYKQTQEYTFPILNGLIMSYSTNIV